jgi:hypothetical protein
MRFLGPMLGISWHVRQEHLMLTSGTMRNQRLLIPALAAALDERGTTLNTLTYSPQWMATNALPEPPLWLLDAFRDVLSRKAWLRRTTAPVSRYQM